MMIDGVEHVEVEVPHNSCTAANVMCGFLNSVGGCTHPDYHLYGTLHCSNPPRMFVLPANIPALVKYRLTS